MPWSDIFDLRRPMYRPFLEPRVPWWEKVRLRSVGDRVYIKGRPHVDLEIGYEPEAEDGSVYLGWTRDVTDLEAADRILRYWKTKDGYCYQSYQREILRNGTS